jgi:dinuclear metal center YbgI/SA1388 family protein
MLFRTCRYDAAPMPTVSDVLAALDRRVPASSAASWDPSGLQLGDASAEVTAVAVCHEVTEAVLERVESQCPELVITYHPLLFRPIDRLVAGSTPGGRALRLARWGVSLAVTHTSFDSAPGGTGDALAGALELTDVRLFGSTGPEPGVKVVTFVPAESVEEVARAMASVGGGSIGNYSGCSFRASGVGAFEAEAGAAPVAGDHGTNRVEEVRVEMFVTRADVDAVTAAMISAHPYEEPAYDVYESVSNARFIGRIGRHNGSFDELLDRVVQILGQSGLRVSPASDRAATVAVLPGSGASFISAAASAGADVLVTGDVDHHRVVAARDGGLSIIDPGHAATERPGMAALVALVRRSLPEVTVVDLTDDDPTPWQ